MAVVVLTREKVDSLADAIIEKAGSSESSITLDEMLAAVSAMESGQAVIDALVGKTAPVPLDIVCASAQSIGNYLFSENGAVRSVSVPNAASVGQYAFERMPELTFVSIPTATSIGRNAFAYCTKLAAVDLGQNLTDIGLSAFANSGLTEITIPASTVTIGNTVFQNCASLARVEFEGTPGSLYAKLFSNCSSLLDIYVPWAEGAVSGAPWGATNATVHYNS